ncbi:hypothetical protein GALMADRAFT_144487 [Galerina marginata CBS 339.88]|uniref:Uncharacterized protein n=1 Tax=Galerina marginata (strain CBS 339.88) TaxID=685588 RepID=A0A067SUY9_GALM3|nr:hypothetical protein GALMADRAFT_144487 [Galerina marginata CBS 339.88]
MRVSVEILMLIVKIYRSEHPDDYSLRLVHSIMLSLVKPSFLFCILTTQDLDNIHHALLEYNGIITKRFGVTFGNIKFIEVGIPKAKEDCHKLKTIFQLLDIQQLNIVCTCDFQSDRRFLLILSEWAPVLQTLRILRIKFIWGIKQFRKSGLKNPWIGPGWSHCVRCFPSVEVIKIDTPLVLVATNNKAEHDWVKSWSTPLPNLDRVYLNHSYDERAKVSDPFVIGIKRIYMKAIGGSWTRDDWAVRGYSLPQANTLAQIDEDPFDAL